MTLNDYKLSLMHHLGARFMSSYGYYAQASGEALADAGSDVFSFTNKNLRYADASGNLVSYVTVYDSGIALTASGAYSVNYIDSNVTLSTTPSGTVTADYQYCTVSIIDSFPNKEIFEVLDLPLLAVSLLRQKGSFFAIGTNASIWDLTYTIDIFANNDPVRMTLMGQLTDFLSKEPFRLVNFGTGSIIDFDGTMNTSFSPNDNIEVSLLLKIPTGEILNFGHISDKEKYRALLVGVIQNIY